VRRVLLSACAALALAGAARAVTPDEQLADPKLEARARALSQELRCLVCQNQSIDDSAAPLAHDLRVILRERIAAGDTDRQAVDYLVRRYGDFVLLRPPFQADTWALWLGPVAVLLLGGTGVALYVRARSRTAEGALSVAEEAELARLLATEDMAKDGGD
jgi:cytochrome c-type biogenesis protein CcmH